MKWFLVMAMLLIGSALYAMGPPGVDTCSNHSATITQADHAPPLVAFILNTFVVYEMPFAGTVPELGSPILSAELNGYTADIWHPPVLNNAQWLKIYKFKMLAKADPALSHDRLCKCTNHIPAPKYFPDAWYDIA